VRMAREVGGGAQCHVDPAWHGSRYVGDEVAELRRPFPVGVGTVGIERVGVGLGNRFNRLCYCGLQEPVLPLKTASFLASCTALVSILPEKRIK